MDNSLDYHKVKRYLQAKADAYSKVDTFLGFNEQELHIELNKKCGPEGVLMVLFKYEGQLNGNNQRTLAGRVIHFAILKDVKKDDFDMESQVIGECENIGFSIVSRIYYDSRREDSEWLYKNFDQNTVEFNEIRLKSSRGLVGMEFSFTLKTPQPLTLNIDDWSDLDE
ncbi:hypothetical protein AWE51_00275 [Aquimarina aggregata]|uniref:Uncharacterized protein n=1 Tax=Aquimarina aggregata TaxID=1642818 RepID=A0A162DSS4_9FLAO|nr:hypothetical protein [Aquimarina aggregata]KZS41917.1 hypothetical protein AWE51_00275 [Aquimarina aggregata]